MADALKDVPVKSVQVEALVSFSPAPPLDILREMEV